MPPLLHPSLQMFPKKHRHALVGILRCQIIGEGADGWGAEVEAAADAGVDDEFDIAARFFH